MANTAAAFSYDNTKWLLYGSGQTHDGRSLIKTMVPRIHPQIRFGKNTVSSPSVLAIERELGMMFDEDLVWLMDVEFYHRIAITLGAPCILRGRSNANTNVPRVVLNIRSVRLRI